MSIACVAPLAQAQSLQNLFGFGSSSTSPTPPANPDATPSSQSPAAEPAADSEPQPAPTQSITRHRHRHWRHARANEARGSEAKATARDSASDPTKDGQYGSLGERINSNSVIIASGSLDATDAALANDLAVTLGDGDALRILPIVSKGGAQTIRAVRFMKGIDVGITQANLLAYFKRTNEIGPIDDKIVYLAKLFNEELHILVRAGSGIATVDELAGKTVNFGEAGSGSQLTARDLFARLGVKVVEANFDQARALHELAAGRIAATVLLDGKPSPILTKLAAGDALTLLPVPYPRELKADYLPASLTADDYPNLLSQPVDTVAVGAVLIAYNWPKDSDRYRRIDKFASAFFSHLADLQAPPRHPKWREINLAAVLPGWQRFAGADEWLRKNRKPAGGENAAKSFFTNRDATDGAADVWRPRDRDVPPGNRPRVLR